jgi:hypothetical protein
MPSNPQASSGISLKRYPPLCGASSTSMKSALPRPIREAAEQEAGKYGVKVTFTRGSKHPFIMEVELLGVTRRVSLSLNNTNNQCDWVRQDIRRMSRELQNQCSTEKLLNS